MKVFSLLSIAVLCSTCWIASVDCSCSSENRTISNKESSKHVICTNFKNSNCLHCKANGKYVTCDTKPAVNSDPLALKGPVPNGLYAIGPVYTHSFHNRSWANLYPRKKSKTGWWDYYRRSPDTWRGYIALHPGSISWGCVTVTDQSCWSKIENMLNSKYGDAIIISRTWFRTKRVRRVGLLRAVD